MTKFYFPHVQTVLKITSSAVQTRFARLDQSLSWIFMKCAAIKITAYWGWTPLQKSDRMGIDNHFWPTSKKKCLKRSVLPQWRRQWFWPSARNQLFRPSVGSNFKKNFCSAVAWEHAWSMIIKQIFSYMHTAGSTGPESKKLSNQVKSGQKLQCPSTAVGW